MEPSTRPDPLVCHGPAQVRQAVGRVPWAWFCSLALVLAWPGAGAHAAEADSEHWPYRIEPGDTLIGVRDQLLQPGTDWRVLQRLNRISNPRHLVPGSSLLIPLSLLRERAVVAEVLLAQGTVTVQRAGTAAGSGPLPLVGGETLSMGDSLRTSPHSSAVLRFSDGARLLLRPDSSLRIDRSVQLGASSSVDTRLKLEAGSAETRVPKLARPRFEIQTPVGNLGVRGTDFRARVSGEQVVLEVLEGQVAAQSLLPARPNAAAGVVAAPGLGFAPAPTPIPINAGFGSLISSQGVGQPRPLPAAPALDAVAERVERLPLRLNWAAAAGASAYRAQVLTAGSPEQLLLDGVFTEAGARWAEDLPDGRYQLRLRTVDVNGLEGFDASKLFTLKARPEPPFTTRPRAAERTGDETVQLAWTRAAGVARYRLQLAASADFARPLIDRDDLVAESVQLPVAVGTHHWRLASIRPDGDQGPWGDPQNFTRVALPEPPANRPAQASAEGLLLSWSESAGARYRIQVARDPAFAPLLVDEQIDTAQWLLRSPEPGQYFVRVRTLDADGFVGPFGAVQQVEVPRSPVWWWLLLPAVLLLL